jgi:hypothetical protein
MDVLFDAAEKLGGAARLKLRGCRAHGFRIVVKGPAVALLRSRAAGLWR